MLLYAEHREAQYKHSEMKSRYYAETNSPIKKIPLLAKV